MLCHSQFAVWHVRFPGPVNIVYKLEAEKFASTAVSRVFFKAVPNLDNAYFIELRKTLGRQSVQECDRHIVYISVSMLFFLPKSASLAPGSKMPLQDNWLI